MSDIKDGGQAFPCAADDKSGWHAEYGMTLRDWFAGQAMAATLTTVRASQVSDLPDVMEGVASVSYMAADAMIAAREVKP